MSAFSLFALKSLYFVKPLLRRLRRMQSAREYDRDK